NPTGSKGLRHLAAEHVGEAVALLRGGHDRGQRSELPHQAAREGEALRAFPAGLEVFPQGPRFFLGQLTVYERADLLGGATASHLNAQVPFFMGWIPA